MGLSTSKSKTKTSGTTQQQQTSTGTTMPVTPQWLTDAAQDYTARIAEFGNRDPASLVAGPSQLQQLAFQRAQGLGGGGGGYDEARAMAQQAGSAGPNLAGAPSTVTGQGYNPGQIGPAAGYSAPQLGTASTYQAPTLGPASLATASDATAQSLLDNLGSYMSPYTSQVVDASLAEYDNSRQQEAARMAANAAKSGAFGGSRYGIAEGQFAADTARGRATTAAQLLDSAFRTGAGLSATDAAARQQASLFNAGNQTQNSQFNANAQNQFGLTQAQMQEAANRYGADAANQFALAQGQFDQNAGQFNANNANQFALAQFGANTDAARYGAGAQNQANLFNAGAQNDFSRFNAAQGDIAAQRQLAAAQLLGGLAGDQGASARADLSLMSDIGGQQRAIDQQGVLAELAQLEAMGQLSGMTPYDILVGRQVNANETGSGSYSGTSVTKSSPSLFNQLLAGAQLAAPFF